MSRRTPILPTEELTNIEAQLAGALRRVQPPKDSIQRLRARIRFPDREELRRRIASNWRRLFLVLSGVMSAVMLLITLARALYYLTGRRA